MNEFLNKLSQFVKKIIEIVSALMKDKWLKALLTILVGTYAVYYLYNQYGNIQSTISGLQINLSYLIISSLIALITFLLSIFSWKYIVDAFGYSTKWIDAAHTQMMSSIGKYIPGRIWNYSSKVYFSNRLGIPIKTASFAFLTEIAISYLLAFSLSLLFMPSAIFPNMNSTLKITIHIFGGILLSATILSPKIFTKFSPVKQYIKNKKPLAFCILIRLGIWLLSGFAFLLLTYSLGYNGIPLATCISTVTSSFFIGFLAFLLPDGIIVRETIIISILKPYLASPDATIISMLYRFQLVIIEFITILLIFIIWKLNRKEKQILEQDRKDDR